MSHPFQQAVQRFDPVARGGRITRVLPTHLEADGPNVGLGALCEVEVGGDPSGSILAEVVGIGQDRVVLAPLEQPQAAFLGARVKASRAYSNLPFGDAFLGRAVDALGRPIDGLGSIRADDWGGLGEAAPAPLDRVSAAGVLETGLRSIDGLLTLGRGQRIGVFAAAGVGKTSLVTQLANQVEADCCILCLVGERGREVAALWSHDLQPGARARTTVVAATTEETAPMRLRACDYALALASHWRAQGRHVLLILDSVTRLAMALREIGLAAGEPPTVRSYTPRVFAALPRIVERCGALRGGGSITAIMTVLCETDDVDDPVAETMKSLLDGHIVLSRELAERAHFPAIDVGRSISRLSRGLQDAGRRAKTTEAIKLFSVYEASRTLIEAGLYVAGSSIEIDRALARRPALLDFVQQGSSDRTPYPETCAWLARAVDGTA